MKRLGVIGACVTIVIILGWHIYFSLGRVDQYQMKHDSGNDWTAGTVGQVFVASRDGQLIGIRIKTQVKDYGKDQPEQRPLRFNLVAVGRGNIPTKTILATGRTKKLNYAGKGYEWRTIYFDVPYQQSRGETLAIIMGHTEDVTPHAWHEIAFTEFDSYSPGFLWFIGTLDRNGGFKEFNGDMAFQTIVTPVNPLKNWVNRLFRK